MERFLQKTILCFRGDVLLYCFTQGVSWTNVEETLQKYNNLYRKISNNCTNIRMNRTHTKKKWLKSSNSNRESGIANILQKGKNLLSPGMLPLSCWLLYETRKLHISVVITSFKISGNVKWVIPYKKNKQTLAYCTPRHRQDAHLSFY